MNNFKLKTITSFMVFFLISAIYSVEYKDVVHLKNGSVVKGTIVENIPNKKIKIETSGGSIFVFKYKEIIKFTKEKVKSNNNFNQGSMNPQKQFFYEDQKKSGGVAFALSFLLIPGAGHFYTGEYLRGFLFLGVDAALVVSAFTLGISEVTETPTYTSCDAYDFSGNCISSSTNTSFSYTRHQANEYFAVALISVGILRIWEWFDAYYSADRYNKKLRRRLGIKEYYSDNNNLDFTLYASNKGYGASLSYRF